MPLLSIVIPAYNEEESLDHAVLTLHRILTSNNIAFEIIFIDDGSSDLTYEKIKEQSMVSDNIHGYRFSRNFGKEAAIWAGLQRVNGDCCIVMDCDLQHPPEVLPTMYHKWEDGYEIVEGMKAYRGKESFIHKKFSNIFYHLISYLSGFDMRSSSDFKLLDKRAIDKLLQFHEQNTFFRGLSFWIGFNSTKIEYEVVNRNFGKTKWNFINLSKYALNNIIGFSTAPLQLVTGIGFISITTSFILSIYTLTKYFSGHSLEGFTTVILLLLLIGGAIMISLGIIGLYIAKIYDEVKNRPRFIISDSTEKNQ